MGPLSGAWTDKAEELRLQTPERNPMSLVMDREKLVVGTPSFVAMVDIG
jgi:hypothetical protein